MAENRKRLFDMFAPVTPEEWRAKAEVDLKGADFDKKNGMANKRRFQCPTPVSWC